jgi:hypothetical protein
MGVKLNAFEQDEFTRAYIEAALWSSNDESNGKDGEGKSGEPLDKNYGPSDISQPTLKRMVADCKKFQGQVWDKISGDPSLAGHDFWLTRNGHGAGFWDGDWPKAVGAVLTSFSKSYREVNLYVGDDGKIHDMIG